MPPTRDIAIVGCLNLTPCARFCCFSTEQASGSARRFISRWRTLIQTRESLPSARPSSSRAALSRLATIFAAHCAATSTGSGRSHCGPRRLRFLEPSRELPSRARLRSSSSSGFGNKQASRALTMLLSSQGCMTSGTPSRSFASSRGTARARTSSGFSSPVDLPRTRRAA